MTLPMRGSRSRESLGQPLETVTDRPPLLSRVARAGAAILLLAGVLIGLAVMKVHSACSIPSSRKVGDQAGVRPLARRDALGLGLQRPTRTAMAMSSDGRFIVYSAIKENPGPQDKPQLYLRRTDQSEAKPIAGTEGGINPFLSPDDRWVGFWAGAAS